ncbi:hypothetical protein C2845_PM13G12070 [Panicum miliaceum]|uniref:Reverse transcriptase zinc-binding domain-containing protein n=1 Tax=Panicum miliaceum TaxID=4540 RepID=A0A3L6RFF4_PANMI|nr:hypothetical protein C2845_PM13G12070 [Panicum miliaceum]
MEEDVLARNYEKSGMYSTRSAYRLLKTEQIQEETSKGNETSASDGTWVWRKLWKLKIPPKIRIFWWRAVQNFLPTKMELCRRHVDRDATCSTCGAQEESLFYVVLECPLARSFWDEVHKLSGTKVPRLHKATWMKDFLTGED